MNRIHKVKYGNTRGKRRAICFILSLFLLFGCLIVPDMEARAESLSVGASASSVKIGDTVTISITVPAGISATVNLTYPSNLFSFQSASETANANAGTVSMTLGGYGGTDTATTGTVKLKAKAAGTATFSASAPTAGNQVGDPVSLGSGSTSVTVKNEASGGNSSSGGNDSGNTSGGRDDDDDDDDISNKSADNSLASLTLSAGKLSPEFKYSTVNYTATVDYSVTSVVVSAKVSNAKATIESVKGGENLVVGENKIQIVVKAENGVTATYTITVTRKAEGDAEEPADEPVEEPVDPAEKCYVVNGVTLYPAALIPEGTEAEGFTLGEVTLWNEVYPAFTCDFSNEPLYLLYLVDENGENGGLYLVLGNNLYEAYDYVCLHSERGCMIVLPDGDGSVPEGYASMPTALNINEYGVIDAWFMGDDREYALVYGMNQLGSKGWYLVDLTMLSYVRYQEPVETEQVEEPSTEQNEMPQVDKNELETHQKQNRLIIGVAVILVLILLIIIIVMAVVRRGGNDEPDEDDLADVDQDAAKANLDYMMESAKAGKRYDKSVFGASYLTDVLADDDDEEDVELFGKSMKSEEAKAAVADNPKDNEKEELKEEPKENPGVDTEPVEEIAKEEALDDTESQESNEATREEEADEPEVDTKMMEQELAAELSKIADPDPMQTVTTYKDEDDDDLEFIDLK